ncbi:MAG: energy transducer TonB [Acidobacteriaceae bacterium]
MAKPLRSDNPAPQSIQFTHFGVLNDGKQSKGAFTSALAINLILAALAVLIGSAVRTVVNIDKPKDIAYIEPVKEPPPAPKPPPPKLPPPPPPKPLEAPKIKPPVEKPLDPKPVEVKMAQPVHLAPAPPRAVSPPPAPVAVNLASPIRAAALKNNDANPSPVRLGRTDSPVKAMTGPAISPVNLNPGVRGMASGNTGNGPRSPTNVSGFGCPNCTNMNGHDRGSAKVVGIKNSVGGNGPMDSKNLTGAPVNIHLGAAAPPPPTPTQTLHAAALAAPPKVTYKPQPVYTEEAKQLHLEGAVSIRIRVTSAGAVQVVAVTHGLGHGLDESAKRAIQGTRFTPALDTNGRPIDWEGVVNVNFQMAG